ncbi:SCP-like protein [Oesophagostomum dentatum]|uniref:SCP-like protein n=1 Tax=Oesophagostomum dentatum TaxID=61180 RepID=A0A0B1TLP0_OESDE|nr:SCP-like protein [Oesophagostomum dentatum]
MFKDELTIYHNMYRARHDAPPLVYDGQLEKAAQRWADVLGSEQGCLVHEQPRIYGENLFYFGAKHFPSATTMAHMVTQSFYMEGSGYNYKKLVY